MSDELTQKPPNDVPATEPTLLTLMERLSTIQGVMDRRHIENQELIASVRDDITSVRDAVNKNVEQKHELVMSRIDLLRTETEAHFRETDAHFRKQALNDVLLEIRGDNRELFERIAVMEEKAP
jgi:BMFP domain-containing protein YqiC